TSVQLPTLGGQLADTGWEGPDAYNKDSSRGMFMTISDTNVIKLYRYDFKTGKQIGETWTIDIPAILRSTSNFNYKLEDRAELAAAPEFPTDAKVETTALGQNSATFKFSLAEVNDTVTDGAIIYYHVFVMDKNNKEGTEEVSVPAED
ncbi:MAG: hypothetical protein IIX61_04295, partial [Loktanella sp.]|nr:hypothetical protein [Loktanella sp.]